MNTKNLKKGDRVRVIASIDAMRGIGIPLACAEQMQGQTLIVVRDADGGDSPLSKNGEKDPPHQYWYFRPCMIEPAGPATVFITERMATAQDLLHQCLSINKQIQNLGASAHGMLSVIDTLRAVIGDEVERQTNGKK
jgi:hypothetical protein